MTDKLAWAVVAALAICAAYVAGVALCHAPVMGAIIPLGLVGGWALHRTKLL